MKNIKKISVLLLAISLVMLLVLAFSACDSGDNGDNGGSNVPPVSTDTTYTIKVVDKNGEGIEGVNLQLCHDGGCVMPKNTDGNGYVVYTISSGAKGTKVQINSVPNDKLILPSDYIYFEDGKTSITITLEEDTSVKYIIKVLDHNGNPISGVNLQLCHDGGCIMPKNTNENGEAIYTVQSALAGPKVQLNSVPQGFPMSNDYFYFLAGSTEITIELTSTETYKVYAKDDSENAIAGAKIELYKKADNTLVEAIITTSDGVAEFTVPSGEYYAIITHVNGALTFFEEGNEDGKHSFNDEKEFTAIFTRSSEAISYELVVKDGTGSTLANVEIKVYDAQSYELLKTVSTDSDGKASFELVNGNYIAVATVEDTKNANAVIFEKDNLASGEITVRNVSAGSAKTNAIIVVGILEEGTIASGKNIWYYAPNAQGKFIVIEGEGVKVTYNNQTYTAENGTVEIEVTEESGHAYFKLTTTEETSVTIRIAENG